jgi:hypothetical protein
LLGRCGELGDHSTPPSCAGGRRRLYRRAPRLRLAGGGLPLGPNRLRIHRRTREKTPLPQRRSPGAAREGAVHPGIDAGHSAKGSRVPAMRAGLPVRSLNGRATSAITARRRAIAPRDRIRHASKGVNPRCGSSSAAPRCAIVPIKHICPTRESSRGRVTCTRGATLKIARAIADANAGVRHLRPRAESSLAAPEVFTRVGEYLRAAKKLSVGRASTFLAPSWNLIPR